MVQRTLSYGIGKEVVKEVVSVHEIRLFVVYWAKLDRCWGLENLGIEADSQAAKKMGLQGLCISNNVQ